MESILGQTLTDWELIVELIRFEPPRRPASQCYAGRGEDTKADRPRLPLGYGAVVKEVEENGRKLLSLNVYLNRDKPGGR